MRLMTDLEAAVARILPAAMVYPDAAPDALGHVLGLLARGHADPEDAIRVAIRTAVAVVRDGTAPAGLPGWRP